MTIQCHKDLSKECLISSRSENIDNGNANLATKEAVIEGGEGRVGGWSTEGKGIRGGGVVYTCQLFSYQLSLLEC